MAVDTNALTRFRYGEPEIVPRLAAISESEWAVPVVALDEIVREDYAVYLGTLRMI